MGQANSTDWDVVCSPQPTPEVTPEPTQLAITAQSIEERLKLQAEYVQEVTQGTHIIFASSVASPEVTMRLMLDLGIQFKVMLGKYKTFYETSFMIGMQHLGTLINSGMIDNEESILVLGKENPGTPVFLVWTDDDENGLPKIESLGTMEVFQDAERAKDEVQNWTYDPVTQAYFTAVK